MLPRAAGDEEVFLTLACLLKRDSVGMFLDELERWNRRHAEEGVGLCASGPWPPYHFTPRLEPA
ncbi:MAG: GvpL/GvpF family gas vesicle protein [Deltaproteobacteria bacterium]|nr:GvpL/GvpF family gas vesicle protein [Deltaproteobacteria bacterium]